MNAVEPLLGSLSCEISVEASDPQDFLLLTTVRYYFRVLRQEKGHQPDASPLDLEILLVVRFIYAGCHNPVDLLRRTGIILLTTATSVDLVLNNSLLLDTLSSSRSRINNTLKRMQWQLKNLTNHEKWSMLHQVLERGDVRNWTIRVIPVESALFSFIINTPSVQVSAISRTGIIPDFED
jgi:hypothetical protein